MKKLWFKRKTYGWGWTPCSWQAWAVLTMYIFSVFSDFMFIDNRSHSTSDTAIPFLMHTYILTVFLLIICSVTGEEPRWQWGEKVSKEK